MNYNVAAYLIFLALVIFIIVYAGRYFYTNGRVFIVSLFNGNAVLADQVNKLLLIAYYLFNVGYSFISLRQWQKVDSVDFSSVAYKAGVLVLILAATHYVNMFIIYRLSKTKLVSITQ
jgi:hypothetical protein